MPNCLTIECWKSIPDFPGYEVSDQGWVRSYWKKGQFGKKFLQGSPQRTLIPLVKKNYLFVNLCKEGPRHHHKIAIHKLVLLSFVGPCPVGMEACHNDGKPNNNFLNNLRWDTRSANINDQLKHGSRPSTRERSATSKAVH